MHFLLRPPILALGFISLLTGLWGGLERIGWEFSVPDALPLQHGPLMISGFLGTLIGLERAVAVGSGWALGIPALTGLGAVGLVAGLPRTLVGAEFVLASAAMTAIPAWMFFRRGGVPLLIMAAGSASWLLGNILWMTGSAVVELVQWWAALFNAAGIVLFLALVLYSLIGHATKRPRQPRAPD